MAVLQFCNRKPLAPVLVNARNLRAGGRRAACRRFHVSDSKAAPAGHLSLAGVLAFASVSIPIAALQLAISVHLPRYFASSIGLELAIVGSAFGLVRLIDIPIDAGIGVAMDRTRTAFGRYRLWMLIGAPILMAGFYMLLAAPEGVGLGYLVLWLLVMYLGYSGVYLS